MGLGQRPKGVDFADIVYQSGPRTCLLYIHFPFGAFYRRQKTRLGPAQATVATAHATLAPHCVWCSAGVARVVYKMLRYKVEYDPLSVNEYQKKYEEQQVKYMRKKAAKFGYQLVPS